MTDRPQWLPETLHFSGNWDEFIRIVYQIFEQDFKRTRPTFGILPVNFDSRIIDGREAGFWHIVQKDDPQTKERLPDLRRCERIPWPKPIIEHSSDRLASFWKNERKKPGSPRQIRVSIWLEEFDYLIILRERPKEMILLTAYYIEHESYKTKLRQERDNFYKMQKPPFQAT